ncbi:MAG: SDR family NAD(P)-dependent oxidoreductase [Aquimonas sp.]|nr:SDR family NAD(P)-dependent oxidoreductase [Aquimonas sp.]
MPVRDLQSRAHVLLAGASSGIGLAATRLLLQDERVTRLHAVARRAGESEALAELRAQHPDRVCLHSVDLCDPKAVDQLVGEVGAVSPTLDLLFNTCGLLHADGMAPEKSLAQLRLDALQRSFAINAFAPILLVQALLPLLPAKAPAVIATLSARVGSIGDNALGGWYSYRAAKAAQNQLMRTLAVELKRSHPRACVLQLHPGTVETPLSAPFSARVPAGKLFSPEHSAALLLQRIAEASPADTGRFLGYDGSEIPW